ncbi:iron-containing alcohol dehydrogenase [Bacteroidales bacterium OttesenSCG-928-B11]|nr:iron-containing alcohol dehydrogenase [Bacteroidales bacterium OttesenSCG-928-E04]MDL2307963.1 iron-containing alcohol dehydrogenase [Bacteroidales bacterium OttesenSCG-928-C03]MDL2311676.1 iron-containing alcohol dehydrogenase [Bacteroidales bacterium OttesenSCG-928-B11]MDL2325753.1 iron-containing alcohol dehydrogenase [Bacteroidales bacterium OttesenSCG-928-A14]
MENFKFANPVKIIFGKDTIKEIVKEIPQNQRVLIIYGGGSIKKNGVYDQVTQALQHHTWFEFSGIEPNPHYETCLKAVELINKEEIDFLLAVGGGSVIDATKFIAAAVDYGGDPWDFMTGKSKINGALPFGTVLTLPATGSEMNKGFVITKAATQEKLAGGSAHTYPKFSVLDPETTYSLPERQTANGIIDTFVHVTEQYLTFDNHALVQDYFAEGILKVLLEEAPKVMTKPTDYNVRANLMWASSWGLNDWIGQGVETDWATHMIGHELTAFYNIDHGQTLAIVLPGVMDVQRTDKKEKILRMGKNIFNITEGTENERIDKTITAVENFFQSLNVKTRLSDYNVDEVGIEKIVQRFKDRKWALGERGNVTYDVVKEILQRRR